MDELDEVLDVAQRQKRAQIMRRYKAKIARSRELAKKRMAPEKNIKKRAYAQARQIVRRKVAGKRGAEYEKLGPSEKMAIDRAVESKQKIIKKIALRLIPRVKQAEQQRLSSFMKGQALQNHGKIEGGSGSSSVQEDLNNYFAEQFPPMAERSFRKQPTETTDTGNRKKTGKEVKGNSNVIQHGKFEEERARNSTAYKAIAKKATNSDISEDILGEVYDRGMEAWYEETGVSQQQYAFARVNSFINQGKSYFNEDADLQEATNYYVSDEDHKLLHPKNKAFNSLADAKRFANTRSNYVVIHQSGKDGNIVSRQMYSKHSHSYPEKPSVGDAKHTRDLHEAHPENNPTYEYTEKMWNARKASWEADQKKKKQDQMSAQKANEELEEGTMKPYVKPHFGDPNNPEKQTGWKSANKHGKTKYWQTFAKSSAEKHAGIKEEVQQTSENFMDGKGPGKPGNAARHGLKGKSATELKKIRSSDTASPRKKQLAHFMLNMTKNEETELDEKRGLWDNIHAKRKRIKAGSGERMRSPGSEGAPTKQNFRDAQEEVSIPDDLNKKLKKVSKQLHKSVNAHARQRDIIKSLTSKDKKDISEGLDSDHYKALTDIELNTKNRDMTTKNDGYGPLNPLDEKGSKKFWDEKAKLWKTTVEAAKEARCGNCAFFNQSKPVLDKIADGIGERGETVSELAGFGFCELWEFKCAEQRTCNTWVLGGPIKEETIGNSQPDPKKRLVATNSLVKTYKNDTPGQSLDESFNIAFASGVGVTLTARDLDMQTQGGFQLHPSVIAEMQAREQEDVEEEVRSADVKGVVVRTASGKTIVRKQKANRKIIGSGNLTDGKPEDDSL